MFKPKITKEEVNTLPVVSFTGKITVVDNDEKVHEAISELRRHEIVGIDTETKPSFTKGLHHKIALVQLCIPDHCFLFRLNKITFPGELADILSDSRVMKVGLALRDDFAGLNKHHRFTPRNVIDLQTIAGKYGILELGLQKIFAIVFNQKVSKSQRLSNWENHELTEQQKSYASTDAWAVLQIYLQLIKSKKITEKQYKELVASFLPVNNNDTPNE